MSGPTLNQVSEHKNILNSPATGARRRLSYTAGLSQIPCLHLPFGRPRQLPSFTSSVLAMYNAHSPRLTRTLSRSLMTAKPQSQSRAPSQGNCNSQESYESRLTENLGGCHNQHTILRPVYNNVFSSGGPMRHNSPDIFHVVNKGVHHYAVHEQ